MNTTMNSNAISDAVSGGRRRIGDFFSKLFGDNTNDLSYTRSTYGHISMIHKPKKIPIKIEPKVFFANERTFLAWLHISIVLAGASIAIVSLSDTNDDIYGQLYGVLILPVAISFIIYSMYQYSQRVRLIRHRSPGPYEDRIGPIVLGIMLILAIIGESALKLNATYQHE